MKKCNSTSNNAKLEKVDISVIAHSLAQNSMKTGFQVETKCKEMKNWIWSISGSRHLTAVNFQIKKSKRGKNTKETHKIKNM